MARPTSSEPKLKAAKKAAASVKHRHSIRAGSPKEKILIQTARLAGVYQGSAPRNFVALLAGYKSKDQAGFKKQLGNLKKESYLDLSNTDTMRLTDKALDLVAPHLEAAPVSNEEIQDRMTEIVTQPKARKLINLLSNGQTLSKTQVAKELGYPNANTPGFKKFLGLQKKNGFVEVVGKDSVRLSDLAFPFGRP